MIIEKNYQKYIFFVTSLLYALKFHIYIILTIIKGKLYIYNNNKTLTITCFKQVGKQNSHSIGFSVLGFSPTVDKTHMQSSSNSNQNK